MPQGRGASKTKKRSKKSEPLATEDTSVNGVLIQNVPGEGGTTNRQIQALGDVTLNELPTLLRLAAKDVEKGLGLE